MTTWPRSQELHRWLPGQDRVFKSGQNIAKTGHDEDYQSAPDGYMAELETRRVAKMAAILVM